MALVVNILVNITRLFCGKAAGNHSNATPTFNPTNEFVTVVALIRKNQLTI